MENIIPSLFAILTWDSLLAMSIGTCIGLLLGAIPGLGGTLGIALAIPFTYTLSPLAALGLLAGIHNGASQGGAIPAILLKIPGSAGAICTAWDGHPMAQKGYASSALNLSATSSAAGGVLGALSLILLAPPLASWAMAFGPAELFWVNVMGIAVISALIGDDVLKGLIAACFGVLIGTVGLDAVSGQERYSFGLLGLSDGVPELAVMVGMFAFPPVWMMVRHLNEISSRETAEDSKGSIWSFAQVWWVWVKSSVIGIVIGILPGSGMSTFIAYAEARRGSKRPEEFGKGSAEGLAAAESVNNADNAAAMIPALTLGVPGSSIAALMLGALLVQGFQPGPNLFRDHPEIVYGYSWQMLVTSLMLILFGGAIGSRIFAQVLYLPTQLLVAFVIALTILGSYTSENSMFAVYLALGFGLMGLLMSLTNIPIAPVIIGLVLGVKAEFSLRTALLISGGNPTTLVHSKISISLIVISALLFVVPLYNQLRRSRRAS